MSTCYKCNQEIEIGSNWRESMGRQSHKMCSGTECALCGKAIAEFNDAKRSPCNIGSGWQHVGCKKITIERQNTASHTDDAECNPSTWNLKR